MSDNFKNFFKKELFLQGKHQLPTLEYWLDKNGNLERASNGHYAWAEQHGNLLLSDQLWEDRAYVYQCMGKKGYARVSITPTEIQYQKYIDAQGTLFTMRLTRAQQDTLIQKGKSMERSVIGLGHQRPTEYLYKYIKENAALGVIETIDIDGIGSISAKVDSGNDGYNVIHGINLKRLKDNNNKTIVKFLTIDDKTVSFPQVGWVEVVAGGKPQQRPVIHINVKVKDAFYQNEPFSIADRSQNEEKVLLGVPFIKKMGAVIDVNKNVVLKENTDANRQKRNAILRAEIEDLEKEKVALIANIAYNIDHSGEPYKHLEIEVENLEKQITKLKSKIQPLVEPARKTFAEIQDFLDKIK